MKLFLTYILFLLSPVVLISQTHRAEQLFEKADSLSDIYDSRALNYYEKSIELARAENNYEIEFKASYRKGIFYDGIGKGDSSLLYLNRAVNLAWANKAWNDIAKAKNSMGVVEFRMGNYTTSLHHYFDALKVAEKQKDSILTYKLNNNIGHVYFYIDQEKAYRYYAKNLDLATAMRDSNAIADSYFNLANIYNQLGKMDSSLYFYQVALPYHLRSDNLYARANFLQNMSLTEKQLGQFEAAEKHLYESKDIIEQIGDQEGLAQSYVNLGDLFLVKKETAKARQEFEKALLISQKINSKEGVKYSLSGLITAEKELKNYQKALTYSEELETAKDELLNNQIAEEVAKMEAIYQNEKKQLQIENLNQETQLQQKELEQKNIELKLQNYLKIGFAIAFFFVLIIAGIILYAYVQKQKSNRSLNEKNKLIQHSLDEKELLMKEIHHRAKNNLQVVSGLLSMQSMRISDEKSKDAMTEATNRVKSMALIHEQLYQPGAQTDLDVQTYMQDLTSSLLQSYNLTENNIHLIKDIAPIKLDVDLMIPIGIMVNEVMSNALKHAFKNITDGTLSLILKKDDSKVYVEIKDNGPGLPPDFNYETAKSFGMRLVHSLAKKIHAEISYINAKGTQVSITIPVKIER